MSFHDPFVPALNVGNDHFESVSLDKLPGFDCVVIVTNHTALDYRLICERATLIVDTRNATKTLRGDFADKIVTL